MSVTGRERSFALLVVASLFTLPRVALASGELLTDGRAKEAESDATDAEDAASSQAAVNASGLVPLAQLNRRPYENLWFADFRYHQAEFGLSIQFLKIRGTVPTDTEPATFDGAAPCLGFNGGYYLPMVGLTPNLSLGLLPELQLMFVFAFTGNKEGGDADALAGKPLQVLWQLPLHAMARFGHHASRVSTFPISLGAGIGATVYYGAVGEPVKQELATVVPSVRFEVGYSIARFSLETSLTDFQPDRDAGTGSLGGLRYHASMLSISGNFQPEPDD